MRTCLSFTVAAVALLGAMAAAASPPVVPQITRPAGYVPGTIVQHEGWIADFFCVNQRWALDAADMWRQPQGHTLHCLIDIQRCIDSGYCLMQQQPDGDMYGCAYAFTQNETLRIKDHLSTGRMERANLKIRFNATWDSATQMAVDVSTVEFTDPAADTTGIVVVLVWSVVSTLFMVLVGGIFNYKGFAITSGPALIVARAVVIGVQLLNVVLIVVVSASVFEAQQVAAVVPRAFGVAISYLFMLVLLPTTKHFGVGYIVGSSYEQFIKYHVLIGLTLWLTMSIHAVGMFVVFADVEPNGAFLFRFSDSRKANGAGFISWVFTTLLVVTGLLRSRMYTAFRVAHYLFAVVLVFGVVHHPFMAAFIIVPLVLWIVDLILRFVRTSKASPMIIDARYDEAARTTLLRLKLKTPMDDRTPGQHVFFRFSAVSAVAQHPFTLAWYDRATAEAAFMVRNTAPGTWTEALGQLATSGGAELANMSWTGPYGRLAVPLSEVGHAMVVAGGIGVTFMTNILSALRNEALAAAAAEDDAKAGVFGKAFPHLRQVTCMWTVREPELVQMAAPFIADAVTAIEAARAKGALPDSFELAIKIFVTRGKLPDVAAPGLVINSGRPDTAAELEKSGVAARGQSASCSAPTPQRTCVYACGPPPVIEAASAAAAANHVLFDEQAFSIGA
jgi:predicted ferric reductase